MTCMIKPLIEAKFRPRMGREAGMSDDSQIIEALVDPVRTLLDLLMLKVNKVTAFHRHGQRIPARHLVDLANFQITVERLLEEYDKPRSDAAGRQG